MNYLLDTCVLSQLRKDVPENIRIWFDKKDQDLFFISSVTIAELWDGIERLEKSKKKKNLEDWFFDEIQVRFKDSIIPIDNKIAIQWGTLNSSLQKKGKVASTQDLYIASTAKANNFILVTLNVKDFEHMEINVVNPWSL